MGNIHKIWLADECEDMETLATRFALNFDQKWSDVMVGANKPFSYHQDWNAYIAVLDMKKSPDLQLSEFMDSKKGDCEFYHLIVG